MNKDRKAIEFIKRLRKKGYTRTEIIQDLVHNMEYINSNANVLYKKAESELNRQYDYSIESILLRHSKRYEDIWERNSKEVEEYRLETDEYDYQWQKRAVDKYMTAMTALQDKEKLYSLHKNQEVIAVETLEIEPHQSLFDSDEVDINRLELEEQVELLGLLRLAKGEKDDHKIKRTRAVSIKSQTEPTDESNYRTDLMDKFENVIDDDDLQDEGKTKFEVMKDIRDVISKEEERVARRQMLKLILNNK